MAHRHSVISAVGLCARHGRNIIIVPHGTIHYLPFNALHDGKGYLIDRYSFRILPSASVIKFLQNRHVSKPTGILAFGNPDLGDPRYDLVYAQNEAISVARSQPQSKVFLRKEATETAFNKYGKGFKYIHFATHGQFNADVPLTSALMLVGDSENDGMLTVDKLYSASLDSDLVTLSACETGLGKIANGDDIVGLTRGFLYAGSSSIVASLWKVDDLATSQLMTNFYSNIIRVKDKREALRQAQLQCRKQYPHPYYWAAFQLTGNAQ
jgi:CHAT domain-containing protein